MTLQHLVLWRHGESEYNAGARMQGQLDPPLTPRGGDQAEHAATELAALGPDALLSSDLSRAADTAAYLQQRCGRAVSLDARLRETHLGLWQGRTTAEVEACWPGLIEAWRGHPAWEPPGGESRIRVADRAAQLVDELDRDGPETAVLCTHGGLIAGLTPLLLGVPVVAWMAFPPVGNAHWATLRRHGTGWRLASYNTTSRP